MVTFQSGVFENLVRNITINTSLPQWNMEEEVSLCGGFFCLWKVL